MESHSGLSITSGIALHKECSNQADGAARTLEFYYSCILTPGIALSDSHL